MERDTKLFKEKFRGDEMFAMYTVDGKGEKVGDYPFIRMGIKKVKAMLRHLEELKKFAEDNSGE